MPGVENMLVHAPPPLAASDLDMRGGHPAETEIPIRHQARFSRLGAEVPTQVKPNVLSSLGKCLPVISSKVDKSALPDLVNSRHSSVG